MLRLQPALKELSKVISGTAEEFYQRFSCLTDVRRRLVNNIKTGDDNQTSTSKYLWDISIEEAEGFDLYEELKTATGIGRRKKRRVSLSQRHSLVYGLKSSARAQR
jgi:hypothetical protein